MVSIVPDVCILWLAYYWMWYTIVSIVPDVCILWLARSTDEIRSNDIKIVLIMSRRTIQFVRQFLPGALNKIHTMYLAVDNIYIYIYIYITDFDWLSIMHSCTYPQRWVWSGGIFDSQSRVAPFYKRDKPLGERLSDGREETGAWPTLRVDRREIQARHVRHIEGRLYTIANRLRQLGDASVVVVATV